MYVCMYVCMYACMHMYKKHDRHRKKKEYIKIINIKKMLNHLIKRVEELGNVC